MIDNIPGVKDQRAVFLDLMVLFLYLVIFPI